MKKLIAFCLGLFAVSVCFASAAAISWLLFSFFTMNLDVTTWNVATRVLMFVVSFILGCAFTDGLVESLK